MATAGAQIIGPLDPDTAGDLVGKLGTHNKAKSLIKRHGQNWPRQLTLALARPKDTLRSLSLDADEVEEKVRSFSGRRAFVRDEDVIEGMAVRGETASQRVVSILFRKESGRLSQGVIPYEGLPRSEAAYERLRDVARGIPPGVPITEESLELAGEPSTSAPADADADARVQAAEDATREAQAEKMQLEEQLRGLAERMDAVENPEPWDGYADAEAAEKLRRLEEGGLTEFGTRGLEQLIAYEEGRPNPHRSVVRAARALLEDAPVDD